MEKANSFENLLKFGQKFHSSILRITLQSLCDPDDTREASTFWRRHSSSHDLISQENVGGNHSARVKNLFLSTG